MNIHNIQLFVDVRIWIPDLRYGAMWFDSLLFHMFKVIHAFYPFRNDELIAALDGVKSSQNKKCDKRHSMAASGAVKA